MGVDGGVDGPVMVDLATAQASLGFARLVGALRAAFVAGAVVPLRHRHAVTGGTVRFGDPGFAEVQEASAQARRDARTAHYGYDPTEVRSEA